MRSRILGNHSVRSAYTCRARLLAAVHRGQSRCCQCSSNAGPGCRLRRRTLREIKACDHSVGRNHAAAGVMHSEEASGPHLGSLWVSLRHEPFDELGVPDQVLVTDEFVEDVLTSPTAEPGDLLGVGKKTGERVSEH